MPAYSRPAKDLRPASERGHSCPQQRPNAPRLRTYLTPAKPLHLAADKNVRAPSRLWLRRAAFFLCLLLPVSAQAGDLYHLHRLSERELNRTYEALLLDACRHADKEWRDSSADPARATGARAAAARAAKTSAPSQPWC